MLVDIGIRERLCEGKSEVEFNERYVLHRYVGQSYIITILFKKDSYLITFDENQRTFSHPILSYSFSLQDEIHYWWCRSLSCGWVFVVAWFDAGLPHKRLSRNVHPLPPTALFHRLDLLSPSEARVCRHFNQMATLGKVLVWLAIVFASQSSW